MNHTDWNDHFSEGVTNMFSKIGQWLSNILGQAPVQTEGHAKPTETQLPVHFHEITLVAKPPSNEQVEASKLYYVVSGDKPKWSLFRCPCGCRSVITLSLQSAHRPHWSISTSSTRRPTLYPSVWRDTGCLSHFWVRDGRISWCFDTYDSITSF